MEASQPPQPPPELSYVFLSSEVIEIHLQRNLPLPEGTAEMIWLINKMLNNGNPEITGPGKW